ncbi:MAG: hypothetical protein II388_04035, partial [Clostridia bacterium]|nr:hypothetical protein [Clostridia bacterium]
AKITFFILTLYSTSKIFYNDHYLLKALATDTFDFAEFCFKSREIDRFALFSEKLLSVHLIGFW